MHHHIHVAVQRVLSPPAVVRIRGERWRVVRCNPFDDSSVLEVQGDEPANRGATATFLLPFDRVDLLPAISAPRVVRPARWRHTARRALADASPAWTSMRTAASARLVPLPFQLEPSLAVLRGDTTRLLIADAVGLGKTIQAGLIVAETLARRPSARVLVVTPAALRDQWCEELTARFALRPETMDAEGVARLSAQLPPDLNPWSVPALAVTSIDYVKRPEVMRCLEQLVWDIVVMDEAHVLAGRSDRAAAAVALSRRARVVVLLTATPHSGDDDAFRRLCGLGQLESDEPLLVFRRDRSVLDEVDTRRSVLLRIRPTSEEAAMHASLMTYARRVWAETSTGQRPGARLAVSVLARRACSSPASLARSVERRIVLLDGAPAELPQAGLPFGADQDEEPDVILASPGLGSQADERAMLRGILALAVAAGQAESKLAALRRFLRRTVEPAIVFTEFRDTLHHVARACADLQPEVLHGGLRAVERSAALRRFDAGDLRLLLATDAASEGLNLHRRCRLVINLELPWTPTRLEQRAGRVDRIGQRRRPHAVHLVAAGTSEERVLDALLQRQRRAGQAMAALERPLDDQQITELVMTSRSPSPSMHAVLPDGCRAAVATAAASTEAARIHRIRGLSDPKAEADTRPVITGLVRRQQRSGDTRLLWAYRYVFTDSEGRVLFESLLGVSARTGDTGGLHREVVTAAARVRHEELETRLRPTATAMREALEVSLGPALARWTCREQAIAAHLRSSRARLAAEVLQRHLFDRRDEDLRARHDAILDNALARSAERLSELVDARHPAVTAGTLVFAALVRGRE